MKTRFLTTALALAAVSLTAAQRMPTVTFTASGVSGDWILDFSLTNNLLPDEGQLYFFGVLLDTGRDISSSPVGWDPNAVVSWNNSGFGGSNLTYNNIWLNTGDPYNVLTGQTQSGFRARSTLVDAPTMVPWFAFASDGAYYGNDYFYSSLNPGFEGMASLVPEPAALIVFAVGLAALYRRRR
ncbi:MAG: PEP-CTERM sorting domain-containing protein [Methanoregulaceae archaeon]|nr:PEP-CTERM sorting domain-containing protein [Methanoregulaceae archaeon]